MAPSGQFWGDVPCFGGLSGPPATSPLGGPLGGGLSLHSGISSLTSTVATSPHGGPKVASASGTLVHNVIRDQPFDTDQHSKVSPSNAKKGKWRYSGKKCDRTPTNKKQKKNNIPDLVLIVEEVPKDVKLRSFVKGILGGKPLQECVVPHIKCVQFVHGN